MKKILCALLTAAFIMTMPPLQFVFAGEPGYYPGYIPNAIAASEYTDPQYSFEDRLENWKNTLFNYRNAFPVYYYPGLPPIRKEVKSEADIYLALINDAITCTRAIVQDSDLKKCVDTY